MEDPLALAHVEVDHSLHLTEKFIIDANVAVRRAADHYFLFFELAAVQVRLVALRDRKDSKLELGRRLGTLIRVRCITIVIGQSRRLVAADGVLLHNLWIWCSQISDYV